VYMHAVLALAGSGARLERLAREHELEVPPRAVLVALARQQPPELVI
jgi:hypothetical protein